MKFIARFLYVPLAGLLVLTSCAKDETESYDKFENQALEAWMTQHRSDLVENLQSEGLYYIDLLDAGDLAGKGFAGTAAQNDAGRLANCQASGSPLVDAHSQPKGIRLDYAKDSLPSYRRAARFEFARND